MTQEGYLTTQEAAEELGITHGRIRHMLHAGEINGALKIPPHERRGTWYIPKEEIERLKTERAVQRQARRRGRPPKSKDSSGE